MTSPFEIDAYLRLPLGVARGEGVFVFAEDGRRYLDLYAGHAVASTGHSHPRVVDAVSRQAARLVFYSNLVDSPVRREAAGRLADAAGPPLRRIFFVNSGAEANEAALRIARRATGRTKVVAVEGSFHGRTLGAAAASALDAGRPPAEARDVVFVDPENIAAARDAVDGDTAAVIVEPIQSLAGVRELSPVLLQELRNATRRHGALLVFDEVQTGGGRLGRYLYSGLHGVHADIVTLAKGIASGVPMGAVLAIEPVAATIRPGELGSTFGGGPLACAALLATLDVLAEERLLERVRETGSWLRRELAGLCGVEEVRGRGLLLGVRLARPARAVQRALLEHGILTGTSADPQVLRLLPPLVLTKDDAAPLLEALPACL